MKFVYNILISLFICIFSASYTISAQDSVGEFFENRFALNPPTEEEELEVVKVIKNFLDLLNSKDLSGAYFLLTSPQFKAATTFDNFRSFIQPLTYADLKPKLETHHVTFTNSEKNKATYTLTLNGKKQGQKFYVEFSLEYQNDIWKIMSMKIYEINR